MTLPGSGEISIVKMAREFNDAAPHAMSEFITKAAITDEVVNATDFYGLSLPPTYGQRHKLMTPSTLESDVLGYSAPAFSADGSTMVLCAHAADINPVLNTGRVFVYKKDAEGDWYIYQELVPKDVAQGYFIGMGGASVSNDGSAVAFGAPGFDDVATGYSNSGCAYLFRYINGSYIEEQKFEPAVPAVLGYYGFSRCGLSGNGTVLVVSSLRTDYIEENGYVDIWVKNAGVWSRAQTIISPGYDINTPSLNHLTYFGRCPNVITSDSNTIFIGAHLFDGPYDDVGIIHVFDRIPGQDQWELVQQIQPNNVQANAMFGRSTCAVTPDGSRLVAAAYTWPGRDIGVATGALFVFDRIDGQYVQIAEVYANTEYNNMQLGRGTVGISADGLRLSAAAWQADSMGNDSGSGYVFEWNGETFGQIQEILPEDLIANDKLGWGGCVLTPDGNDVAVCAHLQDDPVVDAGACYIFTVLDNMPVPVEDPTQFDYGDTTITLVDPNEESGDGDEWTKPAVSADGTVYVSSHSMRKGGEFGNLPIGIVNIWTKDPDTGWAITQTIMCPEEHEMKRFGAGEISMSDDSRLLLVGSYTEAYTYTGSSYLFEKIDGTYVFKQKFLPLPAATTTLYFGHFCQRISRDGTLILIGTPHDNAVGDQAGAVDIWEDTGETFTYKQRLNYADEAAYDAFGRNTLGITDDNSTIVVAAHSCVEYSPYTRYNVGKLIVFDLIDGVYTEVQKILPPDFAPTYPHDIRMGSGGVALSGDGRILVTSTPAKGMLPTQSYTGKAYSWVRENGQYVHKDTFAPEDLENSDNFGYTLNMTNDGNGLYIGAYGDDRGPGGTDSGAIYVYQRKEDDTFELVDKFYGDENSTFLATAGIGVSKQGELVVACSRDKRSEVSVSDHLWERQAVLGEIVNTSIPSYVQKMKIIPDDLVAGDLFGLGAAVNGNGDVMVVGAYRQDDGSSNKAGSAYVYQKVGNDWVFKQKLVSDNPSFYGNFAFHQSAISDDGNIIVIGAYQDDPSAVSNAGQAYVFKRSDGVTWTLIQTLAPYDPQVNGYFGTGCAITGDGQKIVITCPNEGTTQDNSGAVYVYWWDTNSSQYAFGQKIKADDAAADDYFGAHEPAINDDGNILAVAAKWADTSEGTNSGAVYIFKHVDGVGWSQTQKLVSVHTGTNVEMGQQGVEMSSDGSIIMAKLMHTVVDGIISGSVIVWEYDGNNYVETAKLEAEDPTQYDYFGSSHATTADGSVIAVGSMDLEVEGVKIGAVYIYAKNTEGVWTQVQKLTPAIPVEDAQFGRGEMTLSRDGAVLAIGGQSDSTKGIGAGSAFIFERVDDFNG